MQTKTSSKISFHSNSTPAIVMGVLLLVYAATRYLFQRQTLNSGVEIFTLAGSGLVLLGVAQRKGTPTWRRWLCCIIALGLLGAALYVSVLPLIAG
jgi:hypothetical protein